MGLTSPVTTLLQQLKPGPVALDTVIFIYFIEEHPNYIQTLVPVFEAIAEGKLRAATATLTLLETLVVPLKNSNLALAGQYESILTHSHDLELVELTLPILRIAARLRAITNIKTPDAIQLAAAIHTKCSVFLTNDRKIPSIDGIEIIQISDFRLDKVLSHGETEIE